MLPKKVNGTSKRDGRKVPVRMCVVCRERFPKQALTRYICPEPGQGLELIEDVSGKAQGRGFYCCRREACEKNRAKYRGWVKKCKGVQT